MTPVLFALEPHVLHDTLCEKLPADKGKSETRAFPDGESYLRIETPVRGRHCIILADLSQPNNKYLPLVFLASTLRELGTLSIGLIAPYLSYMRQDRRFAEGEAVTSKIFAQQLSSQVNWLVTVDPHLHRYHSLDEIYSIPTAVVQGAPLLADRLRAQKNIFLVGPDSESAQWVSEIARMSGHPFVIGDKQRFGDRDVLVHLPDLSHFRSCTAVIIDDVISSGQTLLKCIDALRTHNIQQISCASVHGIFADKSDEQLLQRGLTELLVSNSISYRGKLDLKTGHLKILDLSDILLKPVQELMALKN
jgi:ribose-phosphate pyrophosphokinase